MYNTDLERLLSNADTCDPRLFGNEAAEDEDPKRLATYFVEKPEFRSFESDDVALSVVRARKGVGKSALLARGAHARRDDPSSLVVALTGADLIGQRPVTAQTAAELINDWQQRLCFAINSRIGQELELALTDDAISLVETSELTGFRERNLIGSLVDRLKGKVGRFETQKLPSANPMELLTRWQRRHAERVAWVFVDDIDATFRSTPEDCLRVSTFFSAARALATQVRGIRLRVSVRADVWSALRRTDEAMDKVEQYAFDLRWSRAETGRILAQRVRAYLSDLDREQRLRVAQHERDRLIAVGVIRPQEHLDWLQSLADENLLACIFVGRFAWSTSPHHFLHVMSGGRPRWSIQLCRLAAEEGRRVGGTKQIKLGFVTQVLEVFGRRRLDDLSREHRHQCPVIDDVIQAFSRQAAYFSTDELVAFLEAAVLRHLDVEIDGSRVVSAMAVAHFLFRCDFLVARDRSSNGSPLLYRYEDKPFLLSSLTNPDEGMSWQVAPAYRKALGMSSDVE